MERILELKENIFEKIEIIKLKIKTKIEQTKYKIEQDEEEKRELSGENIVEGKTELDLTETLSLIKYWQEYVLYYDKQYYKVDYKKMNLILNQDGKLLLKDGNKEAELGNISDCLLLYDNINEEFIPINFNKICVYNNFYMKGIKLNKEERETINNNFFIRLLNDKRSYESYL